MGEGGDLLSVGQKQLISLARAVLAQPEIFIMDEATSSVDTLTEDLIQRGMEALMEDRTSFIIAHRLSTIKRADRILVIESGQHRRDGQPRRTAARPAGTTTGSTRSSSASASNRTSIRSSYPAWRLPESDAQQYARAQTIVAPFVFAQDMLQRREIEVR